MLTFGSLFAGCGGMDLGFERAGFKVAWQVENSDFCNKVLAKHWPNVRRHKDVRDFEPTDEWRVDCIVGGFPCKQTSTGAAIHGRRVGLAGKDSGLWAHYLEVVRALVPEWVVVENPSGAKTWAEAIEGGLENVGYGVQRFELEAADFGAPHRRRRVFWIANRDGKRLALARPQRPPETDPHSRRAFDRDFGMPPLPRTVRVADGIPAGIYRRERIEAIGNAVYPPMAKWIGERIIECHKEQRARDKFRQR